MAQVYVSIGSNIERKRNIEHALQALAAAYGELQQRVADHVKKGERAKAVSANPLDDIPGVGAARKRALLAHFGSAKAVSRANLADLKAVEGVSDKLAETIYAFFHGDG